MNTTHLTLSLPASLWIQEDLLYRKEIMLLFIAELSSVRGIIKLIMHYYYYEMRSRDEKRDTKLQTTGYFIYKSYFFFCVNLIKYILVYLTNELHFALIYVQFLIYHQR